MVNKISSVQTRFSGMENSKAKRPDRVDQIESQVSVVERNYGRLFFLELQLSFGLVFLEERAKLRYRLQQPDPLFVVQRDGKSPQPVHAHAPFFADAELQRAAAASASLLFHFREFCFEFFVCWLSHGVSCRGSSRNRIIQCVSLCWPADYALHQGPTSMLNCNGPGTMRASYPDGTPSNSLSVIRSRD